MFWCIPRFSPPLILTLLLVICAGLPAGAAPGDVETVLLFDAMALETPETVVADYEGNLFIGSAFTGEIYRLTPEGELTVHGTVPIAAPGLPCPGGDLPAILGAATPGKRGTLYANFAACALENRGVWFFDRQGNGERIVELGFDVLPNGVTTVGNRLFIADSLGSILVAPRRGGEAEVWSADPLLAEDPTIFAPGPNGIQYFGGELYVANSDTAQILAFPIEPDGSAGTPRIHSQLPFGCDDFAFDTRGAIYCTTDPFNVVLEISPDGLTITTILDGDDGLDGPTAAAFGRAPDDRNYLYVTNAAFPFFTVANRPSLMKIELEQTGVLPVLGRRLR